MLLVVPLGSYAPQYCWHLTIVGASILWVTAHGGKTDPVQLIRLSDALV
jgi:hypothetical protein